MHPTPSVDFFRQDRFAIKSIVVGLCCFSLVWQSCIGSGYTIKKEAFESVPYSRKMRLYEVEYEIGIAEDTLVAMQERMRELSNHADDSSVFVLDDSLGQLPRKERQQLEKEYQQAFRAREHYLRSSISYLEKRIAVQEIVVEWTVAKYELGKALFARRYRLEGAPDDIQAFEGEVAHQEKRLRQQQTDLQQQQIRLEKIRDNWHKARDQMMSRSVRSLIGLGGDDVPVWELFE